MLHFILDFALVLLLPLLALSISLKPAKPHPAHKQSAAYVEKKFKDSVMGIINFYSAHKKELRKNVGNKDNDTVRQFKALANDVTNKYNDVAKLHGFHQAEPFYDIDDEFIYDLINDNDIVSKLETIKKYFYIHIKNINKRERDEL